MKGIPVPAMEFVPVPAGCFQMGTADGEVHERPVHERCVKAFELGRTEVTQAQWLAVMGRNPSKIQTYDEQCPVESVSWDDAQEFIKTLNAAGTHRYRLPSEAEWEYACREAGQDRRFAGTSEPGALGEYAWFKGDKDIITTYKVAQKKPNSLGLYDMSGNVWEWVQDRFESPYGSGQAPGNKVYDKGGEPHVIRGGSWNQRPNYVRCGIRNRYPSATRDFRIGLRLVREPATP